MTFVNLITLQGLSLHSLFALLPSLAGSEHFLLDRDTCSGVSGHLHHVLAS